MIALLSPSVGLVEIRTIDPKHLVQTISVTSPKYLAIGRAIYIASSNTIWRLIPKSLQAQIEQFMVANQYELSLQLAEMIEDDDSGVDKEDYVQEIQYKFALHLFAQHRFEDSLKRFAGLDTDPREVIGLFPSLLPKALAAVQKQSEIRAPVLAGQELKKGYLALIEYLLDKRHMLGKMKDKELDAERAQHQRTMNEIIDTTLLKCYVLVNESLVGPLLKHHDNNCHLQESERTLMKFEKWSELVLLYSSKKEHEKALKLLLEKAQSKSGPLCGPSRTIEYLQNLEPKHLDLIFEYSKWILQKYPSDGLKIFTARDEDIEPLPFDKVADYLKEYNGDFALRYMEHLVYDCKDLRLEVFLKFILLRQCVLETPDKKQEEKILLPLMPYLEQLSGVHPIPKGHAPQSQIPCDEDMQHAHSLSDSETKKFHQMRVFRVLKVSLVTARTERDAANTEKETLRGDNQRLQERVMRAETDLSKSRKENQRLHDQVAQAEADLRQIRVDNLGLQEQATRAEADLRQIVIENQRLKERAVLAEADLSKILFDDQRLQEQPTELRRISEDNARRCAQLQQERDEARLLTAEVQASLSKYEDVLKIPSIDVQISGLKLGGGAFGEVLVGNWRGCHVAVKTFYNHLRVNSYRRRLEQEVSICSHVHHPNVVSLLGVITEDKIPLSILSELLEGSLCDVVEAADGELTLREQVDLSVGCSSGINYLHALDILHGDIRSTNIVVTPLMEAKLCDLGAARFAEASSLSAGPMSPEYLAPERFDLSQHNTRMSDVYSLGVTFVELMTGEQPAAKKRMAQGTSVRYPIIRRLCLEMIDVDHSKRPSAGECLARLESIQKSDEDYKSCPAKRMVKGKMHGGEKVELVGEPWN